MKSINTRLLALIGGTAALVLASAVPTVAQTIAITNANFNTGTGNIPEVTGVLGTTPSLSAQQIGNTGWYGVAAATNLVGVVGFRPGLEVNNGASSPSRGQLDYTLMAGLGGLLGQEMPEADLYQPLSTNLAANTTYQFSVNFITASALTATLLGNNGFGLGITSGSSTSSLGTFYADSLSNPSLLNVGVLNAGAQTLTFTFTTGASGLSNAGVVVFAGRGNQGISASRLSSFSVDDAALQVVPEPGTVALTGVGLLVLLGGRRLSRTIFSSNRNSL